MFDEYLPSALSDDAFTLNAYDCSALNQRFDLQRVMASMDAAKCICYLSLHGLRLSAGERKEIRAKEAHIAIGFKAFKG